MHGTLPSTIGQLSRLTYLNLHGGGLSGNPKGLDKLTALVSLYASSNSFTGAIDAYNWASLEKLNVLVLASNSFTSAIPTVLANLPQLVYLDLSYNSVSGRPSGFSGKLPHSFGHNLVSIDLGGNNLTGTWPSFVFSGLRNLSYLALDSNNFHGTVPATIGSLLALTYVDFSGNSQIVGSIPEALFDLTKLDYVDLSGCSFSGTVSNSLGRLKNLSSINLGSNSLSSTIPPSIALLSNLTVLGLAQNKFNASLDSLYGLTKLVDLRIGSNPFSSRLSESIGSLQRLTVFDVSDTLLHSTLPRSLGNLTNLVELRLDRSRFSGTFPTSLENLRRLAIFQANANGFTGRLPPEMSAWVNIEQFSIYKNNFSHEIPVEWGSIWRNLSLFDASDNNLRGGIPLGFMSQPRLQTLVLSKNCMTFPLPADICLATKLETLLLDGLAAGCPQKVWSEGLRETFGWNGVTSEKVQGTIPHCLFGLPSLVTLHASGNGLSSSLPLDPHAWSSSLRRLELSNNLIFGDYPYSLKNGASQFDLISLGRNRIKGTLDGFQSKDNLTLYLAVNRLSGEAPESLSSLKIPPNILMYNLFDCHSLPSNDFNVENYDCGYSTNSLFYTLIALVGIAVGAYHFRRRMIGADQFKFSSWRGGNLGSNNDREIVCDDLLVFLADVQTVILTFACFLIFLLPIYSILKLTGYSSHTFTYIWNPSAVFITGKVPAAILVAIYSSLLSIAVSVLCQVFDKSSTEAVQMRESTFLSADAATMGNSWKVKLKLFVRLLLVVTVNVVASMSANALFVQVTSSTDAYTRTQKHAAVFMLTVFKLCWRGVLNRLFASKTLLFGVSARREKAETFLHLGNSWRLFLQVFNIVVAPALATAVASGMCFATLFHSPQPISSSYTFSLPVRTRTTDYTELGQPIVTVSTSTSTSTLKVAYTPPWFYSYQCSSNLALSFVPVFLSMVLAQCFIVPGVAFLARYVLDTGVLGELDDSTPPLRRAAYLWLLTLLTGKVHWTRMERTIFMPEFHLQDNETSEKHNPNEEPSEKKQRGSLLLRLILQRQRRFIDVSLQLDITMDILLTLSFGIICPLLGVALTASCYFRSWRWSRLLRSFIEHKDRQLPGDLNALADECRHFSSGGKNPIYRVRYLLLLFPSMYLGLFVWDMASDDEGVAGAVWAPLVMSTTPLALFVAFRKARRFIWKPPSKVTVRDAHTDNPIVATILEQRRSLAIELTPVNAKEDSSVPTN